MFLKILIVIGRKKAYERRFCSLKHTSTNEMNRMKVQA